MRARVVLSFGAALIVTGCSGAVEIALPAESERCPAAALNWPATVSGHSREATSPDDAAVASWGDPPVIARCGLAPLVPTEEPCIEVDGVDWVAQELSDGTRLTTFGRDPAIELLVPAEYDPAPLLLPAFTEVAAALPTNGLLCR